MAKAARGAWARECVRPSSAREAPGSSKQGPAGPSELRGCFGAVVASPDS